MFSESYNFLPQSLISENFEGMTEDSFHFYWKLSDRQLQTREGVMGLGSVSPGSRVRICVHGSRQPAKRGEIGALHVGGPPTISRYLQGRDKESFYVDEKASPVTMRSWTNRVLSLSLVGSRIRSR